MQDRNAALRRAHCRAAMARAILRLPRGGPHVRTQQRQRHAGHRLPEVHEEVAPRGGAPPGPAVLDAIKKSAAGEKKTSIEGGGGDPADSDSRDIVGPDNRVQITNSTTYPYTTIGYLQMETQKGEVWSCTAAMIGPKTAITAANCLYNHGEPGGWRENVVFWPALNGKDNAPYGGFYYDTEYVFQAYITDYDGTYDGVWQYDVGLVTFKDAIGEGLGWLGYNANDIGDFQGTVVGYHDDKEPFTMWKSTCNVIAENISQLDIIHDCDTTGGTDGAPIYYYDQASKGRIVVGINIGPSGDANWALKLTPDAIDYLMRHAPRDMRTLSSIVVALDRYTLEQKRAVTLPLLRELLHAPHA